MSTTSNPPQHVEHPVGVPPGPTTANPLARGLNVTVSIPENIEVRMVELSALEEYELFFFLSSVLASAVTGFLVAFLQSGGTAASGSGSNPSPAPDPSAKSFLASTIIFGILFLASTLRAFQLRGRIKRKSRAIHMTATDASVDGGAS